MISNLIKYLSDKLNNLNLSNIIIDNLLFFENNNNRIISLDYIFQTSTIIVYDKTDDFISKTVGERSRVFNLPDPNTEAGCKEINLILDHIKSLVLRIDYLKVIEEYLKINLKDNLILKESYSFFDKKIMYYIDRNKTYVLVFTVYSKKYEFPKVLEVADLMYNSADIDYFGDDITCLYLFEENRGDILTDKIDNNRLNILVNNKDLLKKLLIDLYTLQTN